MEPLSHYHCEIYHCKHVPINLNHASNMHQLVPQLVINLYHKQVHQPCTNLYQTTCTINKCINHAPTYTSTCTMNKCINHVPNLYLNLYHEQVHQPCTKPIQITCHTNMSKQPITTTCLINLINQIISTHQDQSPRQLSNMCINQA